MNWVIENPNLFFFPQNLQEWFEEIGLNYFCIIGRCIQQYCDKDDDCPGDDSQCINLICLSIITCIDDNDCGGVLICAISDNEEEGICKPEDELPPECTDIDLSACPPVSNLIFSNYLTNSFPLPPFPFPHFPFLHFPLPISPFSLSPAFFFLAPVCHDHFIFL